MFSPTILLPPSPSHFTPPSSPRGFSSPFGQQQQQQPPLASFPSSSSPSSSSRKRNRDEAPFVFHTPPQRKRVCDSQRFVLKGSRKRKRPGEDAGTIFEERPEMSVADLPLEVINPHKRVRATLPEQNQQNLPQTQIIEEPMFFNNHDNDERSLVLYHPNQDRSLVLYGQQRQQGRRDNQPFPSDANDRSLVPFRPRYNSNVDYEAFAPHPTHFPQCYPNTTHDVVLYQSRGNEETSQEEEDSLMRDID